MELRRSREQLVSAVLVTIAGLAMLLCETGGGITGRSAFFGTAAGLVALAGAAWAGSQVRPFRFGIGPEGLALRTRGINRLVPWAEIDAVILDQPRPKHGDRTNVLPSARLVLVPAAWSELAGRAVDDCVPDGRKGLVILELSGVKQSRDQISGALRNFSGGRFTDALREKQSRLVGPRFDLVEDGYVPEAVNKLIELAGDALASGQPGQRFGARLQIEGTTIPVAGVGYDRTQVDSALRAIAAELAGLPSDDHKPRSSREGEPPSPAG